MITGLISDSNRNSLSLIIILVFMLLLGLAAYKADEQEKQYLMDRQLYYTAVEAGNQKNFVQAAAYLEQTSETFQASWLCIYTSGYMQFQQGDFKSANQSMQRAEDISPVLLTNPDYLLIRSSILISLKEYDEASEYLAQADKYVENDQQKSTLQNLNDTLY